MSGSVTAIVPMRHESVRVPGKNYRAFAGRPLYQHVIETLLACDEIAQVVISTDSPTISAGCADAFPEVRVLERPEHLRADTIPMNDVLLHVVDEVGAEHYLQTHSTNPLLRTETVQRAVGDYFAGLSEHDSLFSVTRLQTRLWSAEGRPMNHDPAVLLRTQDLPPVFEENSCLFIFSAELLRQRRNRIGERPLLFEMDPHEAIDIDTEFEFLLAEAVHGLIQERGR